MTNLDPGLDRDLERLRSQPIPWDDLREQRVLARIEAAKKAPAPRRQRLPWPLLAAVVALLLGAGLAFVTLGPTAETVEVARSASWSTPEHAPTLTLRDGSTARLEAGADVDVLTQVDTQIRIAQTAGAVRYDVTKNPARSFIVDADGVSVRVLGTAFTVSMLAQHVAVHVHHGRVEVRRGDRVSVLGLGESIQVERGAAPEPEPEPVIVVEEDAPQRPAGRSKPKVASVDALQARADEARAHGQLSDAATALRQLVRHHRKDARAYSAWFQLGKVERSRGKHAAAAAAFEACAKRSPSGALSEDARAEAAASWKAADNRARAHAAAQAYLRRHPDGTHAARMQRIVAW
ncbi:MAG: FecR family protein [Myxococcota bacterium]